MYYCLKADGLPHGTDESDVRGLAVQHRLVRVDPQAGHLGQHVDHLTNTKW